MELFEFVLILLACVTGCSIWDQVISRVSLPLIQIGVGLVLALLIPRLSEAHVDSELFLMLFIAPLLFREARETSWTNLWSNRWSVLSMAIALVIVSVIAGGFVLHGMLPAIPLAAAFACAAALGPTDAAAVAALGPTISLSERQSILLSGEALINDASGVVSFQFAIGAAVIGIFHPAQAVGSFAILFFGGIAIGILMGFLAKHGMMLLKRHGYASTMVHVVYEVLTPFLFFLFAEELHVSGILAVVAAGLMMQEQTGHIIPPEEARKQMISNSLWEVIVFLINGIIFVMLGMQLPLVMQTEDMSGIHPGIVLTAVLLLTMTIIAIRFLWLAVMELVHKDGETGLRGSSSVKDSLHRALVTTLAGPKGAVTLSIIMTIPLTMEDDSPFPQRDLIIFVTSAVILWTLLFADILLPLLAPKKEDEGADQRLTEARALVLESVIRELRKILKDWNDSPYSPALRLELMRYRIRLMRLRFAQGAEGEDMTSLIGEVLEAQQKRADELQRDIYDMPEADRMPYYDMLRGIRASIGYFGGAQDVGSLFETKKGRFLIRFARFRKHDFDDEKFARIYYDTCVFAIDLEMVALELLQEVKEKDPSRAAIADVLIEEHKMALQSVLDRINFGQDNKLTVEELMEAGHNAGVVMPEGMRANTAEQFRMARAYHEEAGANTLSIELDQIRRLRFEGKINEAEAKQLREEVYLVQTTLLE